MKDSSATRSREGEATTPFGELRSHSCLPAVPRTADRPEVEGPVLRAGRRNRPGVMVQGVCRRSTCKLLVKAQPEIIHEKTNKCKTDKNCNRV